MRDTVFHALSADIDISWNEVRHPPHIATSHQPLPLSSYIGVGELETEYSIPYHTIPMTLRWLDRPLINLNGTGQLVGEKDIELEGLNTSLPLMRILPPD